MKTRKNHALAALCLLCVFRASAATHYVNVNNSAPAPPYTNWAAAAVAIQDALDVAGPGDQILVTNGSYQVGTRIAPDGSTNRVVVTNALALQSVNGFTATSITGATNVRCVYLTNGAFLAGFTLNSGNAANGGGIYCPSTNVLVSNCWLIHNTAGSGGGAYSGTFTNCTFWTNQCPLTGNSGGGAYGATLYNCLLSNNYTGSTLNSGATCGGGACASVLYSCTLFGNNARGAGANGGNAYNCVLSNCTLKNGYADFDAGGAYESTLTNCILYNNRAPSGSGGGVLGGTLYNCGLYWNSAGSMGGGADFSATLYNCILTNNTANYGGGEGSSTLVNCLLFNNSSGGYGGGAYYGTLINCTLVSNTTLLYTYGGGAYNCTLDNSVIYYNTAGGTAADVSSCTLNYCCSPAAAGFGNITNAPLFVAPTAGNCRLQSNSPCINSGRNSYVTTTTDLDGNPRIAGGTVDMGAYEYATPASLISYAWLQQYGLPIDGSADSADYDNTGMTVYQDWIAGLNPTNPLSVLKMNSVLATNSPPGLVVTWQSVSGVTYFLQSSSNLGSQPAFSTIRSNITGQSVSTSYTDTAATNPSSYFYRVGVSH
jgi:hypothetical protein